MCRMWGHAEITQHSIFRESIAGHQGFVKYGRKMAIWAAPTFDSHSEDFFLSPFWLSCFIRYLSLTGSVTSAWILAQEGQLCT